VNKRVWVASLRSLGAVCVDPLVIHSVLLVHYYHSAASAKGGCAFGADRRYLNAPMLQSSKDLFYIVLAFSALWLTIFLCWMIYSVAVILRNANDVIHEMRERLRGISESLDFMRDKVDVLAGSVDFLTEAADERRGGVTDVHKTKK